MHPAGAAVWRARRVQQVPEVRAIGPDLPAMHGVYALRESFQRLVAEDDAVGAAAECVNYQVAIARRQQHRGTRLCVQFFGWRGRAGSGNYECDRGGVRDDSRLRAERLWPRGAWSLLGACSGFLVFNFPPAKIFIGDSGSTVLGFSVAFLGLDFISAPSDGGAARSLLFSFFDCGAAVVACFGGGDAARNEESIAISGRSRAFS